MDPIAFFIESIWKHQLAFLFVLARVAGFTTALPFLGGEAVPGQIKALFALSMAFVLFPIVTVVPPALPLSHWTISFGIFSEIMIGSIIGFGTRLIFAAVDLGAEVAGVQIGFGLANAFDPVSNQQVSLTRQIYVTIAFLVFLAINGHHAVLQSMVKSFEVVPSTGFYVDGPLMERVLRMGSDIFTLALKIALPVTMALLLTQIALGVLSRVVPQIQVFLFSFPLTIGIGLFIFGSSLSLFVALLKDHMGGLGFKMYDLLILMKQAS